jgi:uncharacterized membrane protein (UPF0136 family)
VAGTDEIPETVREQLAEHAWEIVRSAALPESDREDVAEELSGHLEASFRAARADRLTDDDAVAHAVAAFGGNEVVARELMVTYRGRVWASTIGQLLPLVARAGDPPSPMGWLVRFDRIIAVLSVLGAVTFLLTGSPVRAIVGFVSGVAAAAVVWLAATALRRGQRWALNVSALVCAVNALIFFVALAPPGGGINISLTGLLGLVLLLRLAVNLAPLNAWVAGSRPISAPLGGFIGGCVIAWSGFALAGGNIPDPTQIGPADVRAIALVTCRVPPGTREGAETSNPAPTLDLEVTYDRVDAWPRGLLRDRASWGDVIRLNVGPSFYVSMGDIRATGADSDGTRRHVDVSSWVDVPADLSPEAQRQIVGEILGTDQRAGRTIHLIAPTLPLQVDADHADDPGIPPDGIVASIELRHLDRFTLRGFAGCDAPIQLEPRD